MPNNKGFDELSSPQPQGLWALFFESKESLAGIGASLLAGDACKTNEQRNEPKSSATKEQGNMRISLLHCGNAKYEAMQMLSR